MTMTYQIELLDTVALVTDIPSRNLKQGEVGTVVELLDPDVFGSYILRKPIAIW